MWDLLRRSMYLAYYLKETDRKRLRAFASQVCHERGLRPVDVYADAVRSSYRYNTSLLDYFYFRFPEQPDSERDAWAGTGFMYEYQRTMNPPGARAVLQDKVRFLRRFRRYVRRPFADLETLRHDPTRAEMILSDPSGRIVLKKAEGQCGRDVKMLSTAGLDPAGLVRIMSGGGYDLAEGYVVQHPALMALSPSGLNTIRIFTQLVSGEQVHFLGARLRISVDSPVDNLAAGNLAAPVDSQTGSVCGAAVYSDIRKAAVTVHPVTGAPISGFLIPFWTETLSVVQDAALLIPDNRSVGWDVAVTESGPELIEGNHNWCKLLWQLPVGQGLKHLLLPYL